MTCFPTTNSKHGASDVRLLLDTHALIWWLAGDRQLPDAARNAITDVDNSVYVSAASAWEVTAKARLGKAAKRACARAGLREPDREGRVRCARDLH